MGVLQKSRDLWDICSLDLIIFSNFGSHSQRIQLLTLTE